MNTFIIIIIISGFGIYGAAVVPDSGVGNTWQRLTLVLFRSRLTTNVLSFVADYIVTADLPRGLDMQ